MPAHRAPARGFTYFMLLWWVFISGIMLMALSHTWALQARRAKEAEMLFRAEQIVQALRSYQRASAQGQSPGQPLPSRLEDLLEDQRSGRIQRHLRKLWPDPVTGGPWGLVLDAGAIVGVYSPSALTPLAAPDGVGSYQDWQFRVETVGESPSAPTPMSQP
jgi:type II secretory pathway pseudopilin PulG